MRLPNPLAAMIDLFTARNWDQVGAAEAFKRMCLAWAVVVLLMLTGVNALIVFVD